MKRLGHGLPHEAGTEVRICPMKAPVSAQEATYNEKEGAAHTGTGPVLTIGFPSLVVALI